jgi:hypothetical protein
MDRIRAIVVCVLSLSLIVIAAATIPTSVNAQEVVSLNPATFAGQRLSDTELSGLTGMAGFQIIQSNFSTGTNNSQTNTANNVIWTSQGTQTTNLDPNTTQALKNLFSFFKFTFSKK